MYTPYAYIEPALPAVPGCSPCTYNKSKNRFFGVRVSFLVYYSLAMGREVLDSDLNKNKICRFPELRISFPNTYIFW